MQIFFSVGEPSGDQHAAHLIHELKRRNPRVEARGFGGPLMEQAGCRLDYPLTNLAVMGFLAVLPMLWKFIRLVRHAGQIFRESPPDAVVLVDFPGFNWWIARKAKRAGIPVFYYMPPQLWAWHSWRVRRMRKYVDHVLCGLPFEPAWYAARGVHAEFVGHPFFDEVKDYPLDRAFCDEWSAGPGPTVGILPGSRNYEITRNWPVMLDVMAAVHRRHPQARFLAACYKEEHRARCRAMLEEGGLDLPLSFFVGKTPEIIEAADCCLMVSGSVSLEMMARRTPAVVTYRLNRLTYAIVRPLVHVKSISLPNLIADRIVFREWVVSWFPRRDAAQMAAALDDWLSHPDKLAASARELDELCQGVVQTGATQRTAEYLLRTLSPRELPARSAA